MDLPRCGGIPAEPRGVYFLLSQMLGNLLSVAAVWHAGHVHPSGRPIAAWHRAVGRSALIFCSDLPPVPPERAREDSKDSNLPEATEEECAIKNDSRKNKVRCLLKDEAFYTNQER